MRNANIQADFEHWPVLTWSRFTSFPYQHLQALRFDYESVYCYLTLSIGVIAVGVSLMEVLYYKRSLSRYGDWLCILFNTLALPTRVYNTRLEGKYAATARARRARYICASSFWNEDKTKKILSRSYWTIPHNRFLMDMVLATFFISSVIFATRVGLDSLGWPFTLEYFALEYCIRCLFHIFVQVRWVSSTLELHDKHIWRLFSSLMSIQFFRGWTVIICLFIALLMAFVTTGAFSMLRLLFPGQNDGEKSWDNYLFGILGLVSFPAAVWGTCFFLFMSGCQIWDLTRDTIWRVKRTCSRDNWARRHISTSPDREIRLV